MKRRLIGLLVLCFLWGLHQVEGLPWGAGKGGWSLSALLHQLLLLNRLCPTLGREQYVLTLVCSGLHRSLNYLAFHSQALESMLLCCSGSLDRQAGHLPSLSALIDTDWPSSISLSFWETQSGHLSPLSASGRHRLAVSRPSQLW